MSASIEYSERPSDSVKRYIRATQAGVVVAGEMWVKDFMPRHFTPEAKATYNYTPRSGEGEPAWLYSTNGKGLLTSRGRIRRNRKYYWNGFSGIYLVKSGDSEAMATRGARVRKETVDDGTVRAVVRIPVPQYFFMWKNRADGKHVDKVKELSTIIPAEATATESAVRATIDQMMSRFEGGSRRTVRAA